MPRNPRSRNWHTFYGPPQGFWSRYIKFRLDLSLAQPITRSRQSVLPFGWSGARYYSKFIRQNLPDKFHKSVSYFDLKNGSIDLKRVFAFEAAQNVICPRITFMSGKNPGSLGQGNSNPYSGFCVYFIVHLFYRLVSMSAVYGIYWLLLLSLLLKLESA